MSARISSTLLRSCARSAVRPAVAALPRSSISSTFASSSSSRSFSCNVPRFATAANSGLFPPSPSEPSPEHTKLVQQGTQAVEDGDYKEAKRSYEEALKIERNGTVLFNLGVVQYCLKEHKAAISSWLESIAFDPENADAHTNLASAYILSTPPQGEFAEKHLRSALTLSPLDPEISFNLAAVLEARGQLQEALSMYERARGLGVERADQNVRSVGAKIMAAQAAEEAASGNKSA